MPSAARVDGPGRRGRTPLVFTPYHHRAGLRHEDACNAQAQLIGRASSPSLPPRPHCDCIASKSEDHLNSTREKRPWIAGWGGGRGRVVLSFVRTRLTNYPSIPRTRKMPTPWRCVLCWPARSLVQRSMAGAVGPTVLRPYVSAQKLPAPLRAWPALTSITCFGRAGRQ